ncbi:MAG TPA: hypothetical protein VFH58_14140 [Acidimicrobiales bacterium]|nr:hypothetical protein [Acidimicrobiales bacterium]
MTADMVTTLRRLCRLVAARAPAGEVEAELGNGVEGREAWAVAAVDRDAGGHVEFVHLEPAAGTLTLDDLGALGPVEPLPAAMVGDPSSHLLVVDDPELPELCRVVISAGADERVSALSLQPDMRL